MIHCEVCGKEKSVVIYQEHFICEECEKYIESRSGAYNIICPKHGKVQLDYFDYIRQLYATDTRWLCPKCYAVSEFDDESLEIFEHLLEMRENENN
jgi:predicted RNA-binding Zn-ribbon protein involved in translation (DUF1610 family)